MKITVQMKTDVSQKTTDQILTELSFTSYVQVQPYDQRKVSNTSSFNQVINFLNNVRSTTPFFSGTGLAPNFDTTQG